MKLFFITTLNGSSIYTPPLVPPSLHESHVKTLRWRHLRSTALRTISSLQKVRVEPSAQGLRWPVEFTNYLCSPLSGTQQFSFATFNQRITSFKLTCGSTMCVLFYEVGRDCTLPLSKAARTPPSQPDDDNPGDMPYQFPSLVAYAITDSSEPLDTLRFQLRILCDALVMRFGPLETFIPENYIINVHFQQYLNPLVDALLSLSSSYDVGLLLGSVNRLKLSDPIDQQCHQALEAAAQAASKPSDAFAGLVRPPRVMHLLLFIGNKLAGHYAAPGAPTLGGAPGSSGTGSGTGGPGSGAGGSGAGNNPALNSRLSKSERAKLLQLLQHEAETPAFHLSPSDLLQLTLRLQARRAAARAEWRTRKSEWRSSLQAFEAELRALAAAEPPASVAEDLSQSSSPVQPDAVSPGAEAEAEAEAGESSARVAPEDDASTPGGDGDLDDAPAGDGDLAPLPVDPVPPAEPVHPYTELIECTTPAARAELVQQYWSPDVSESLFLRTSAPFGEIAPGGAPGGRRPFRVHSGLLRSSQYQVQGPDGPAITYIAVTEVPIRSRSSQHSLAPAAPLSAEELDKVDAVVTRRVHNSLLESLAPILDILFVLSLAHMRVKSFVALCPGLVHFALVDRSSGWMVVPRVEQLTSYDGGPGEGSSNHSAAVPSSGGDGDAGAGADGRPASPPDGDDYFDLDSPQFGDGAAVRSTLDLLRQHCDRRRISRRLADSIYHARARIAEGYTSGIARVGPYQYFHNVWFEAPQPNGTSEILPIEQALPQPSRLNDHFDYFRSFVPPIIFPELHSAAATTPVSAESSSSSGSLSDSLSNLSLSKPRSLFSFASSAPASQRADNGLPLIQGRTGCVTPVKCLEIYTVFVGTLPEHEVISQTRRLVKRLRETESDKIFI
ncbi:hypothetical protein H696_02088 [Fonticula alba]|uniref:Uncharacterized protein n=1 Tax=Fonticula alba TaxID=691883 RepID=A0A058ZCH5_FONAL|nr:hypothetical protein H696_02088 [Fonticula alba]KCV71137.1 hypothetical protein H696_02088 [Fonticula alba]|eukprot:XP_009494260.1 hypothetical protein H696_02088 [Fonticula alba]